MIEEHFGLRETPFTREIAIDKKMTLPFLDEQAKVEGYEKVPWLIDTIV